MAVIKCTSLFQLTTNSSGASQGSRVAGWSEGLLFSGTASDAIDKFNNLCIGRAAMLATSAAIVGQRYQLIDPSGRTQTARNRYPGTLGSADVPQMGCTFTMQAQSSLNVRRFTFRGLPDQYAVEGEFKPDSVFVYAFALWRSRVAFFGFKCLNLGLATVPVTSIAADGTFVLQQPLAFIGNDYLHIRGATDVSGNVHNGRFHVQTATDSQHGKFDNWVGLATLGGNAKPDAYIFQTFNAATASTPTLTLRKAGRPFDQYRGRASVRR